MLLFLDNILWRRAHFICDTLCTSQAVIAISYRVFFKMHIKVFKYYPSLRKYCQLNRPISAREKTGPNFRFVDSQWFHHVTCYLDMIFITIAHRWYKWIKTKGTPPIQAKTIYCIANYIGQHNGCLHHGTDAFWKHNSHNVKTVIKKNTLK